MKQLIQAEYIKGRRSFGRRSMIIFPMVAILFAVFLMSGQLSQIAAYNWWYILLLPAAVAFLVISLINSEKRMGFINLKTLPISSQKIWVSKIITGFTYLFLMNVMLFGFSTISGLLFGSQYPIWGGLLAGLLLTITWAWQVPLGMWLVTKFNSTAAFLCLIAANTVCSFQDIAGGQLWYIPFAIPPRLMTPIIGINPNGVPLSANSPLWNTSVILPGVIITIFLFIFSAWFTTKSFDWSREK
ncbi:lantibiotic immunity ABC transporter MutE/EpiE family permease subunit [Enterococcus alishanensis]|uniref:Lantibiotic immunity ABC transporter MutE/EpiE family permease subunit n=1 Tax=Enterococcus alishanensis TaxID=1303817 RepID=A0ABS6TGJ2_9ENTE|nr:lantibiotic immunity ABC transporter MutE/EpiE family permease subunit [Enterococcus alishanensis]MBV7392087.1 lantibiotic immunity ABC transporter MutE/EpiE family permease subunit [Enterococcus alishanensis]